MTAERGSHVRRITVASWGSCCSTGWPLILFAAAFVWGIHFLWLVQDTRPPVWDMAMHQSFAFNYFPDGGGSSTHELMPWERSGNYPPFVHWVIALCLLIFGTASSAVLANLPATILLFWAVYRLGEHLANADAGRWAVILTVATPYLFWMSRETILDYWLSGWVAAAVLLLYRSEGFGRRHESLLFGVVVAFGLLTKWLFVGFLIFPVAYVFWRGSVWKHPSRVINAADSLLIGGIGAATWYLPNVPKLVRYFGENTGIGVREGEPPILSFQSAIYYLRLLEGYQLFALLFVLVGVSCLAVYRQRLIPKAGLLVVSIIGGWLCLTLLQTKDPRFSMPLLPFLLIVTSVWIQAWKEDPWHRMLRWSLVLLLGLQLYAINFGIRWLPQEVVLLKGYQGSLRWDWNLYLQSYFGILGKPEHQDWKQRVILERIVQHSRENGLRHSLAIVADLPRFNAANFLLQAKWLGISAHVDHLQSERASLRDFDGFNYVLITEVEQGMSWTTPASHDLNQIVMGHHQTFKLVDTYPLPNGDAARLYFVDRRENAEGS